MRIAQTARRIEAKFLKRPVMLAATFLASVTVLFAPALSQATAYGCAWGNPNYGPTTYCVLLAGQGTYVSYVSGTYRGSATVCDASITAEFFDMNWNWYRTLNSATAWGCGTGGGASIGVYGYVRQGYMCSTLRYTLLARRTMSVCHAIR